MAAGCHPCRDIGLETTRAERTGQVVAWVALVDSRDNLLRPEDQELLELLAEQPLLLLEHFQSHFRLSATEAGARVGALEEAGLVRRDRASVSGPWSFRITSRGLAAIGSGLPAPAFDPRRCRHDVGAAWIWLAAKAGTFRTLQQLLSERVMRHHDQTLAKARLDASGAQHSRAGGGDEGRFGVSVGGGVGRTLVYPDLMLVVKRGRCPVVFTRVVASILELEAVLAGYGADPRIFAVLYLVSDPMVGVSIGSAAERLWLDEFVRIQLAVLAPACIAAEACQRAASTGSAIRVIRVRGAALRGPRAAAGGCRLGSGLAIGARGGRVDPRARA